MIKLILEHTFTVFHNMYKIFREDSNSFTNPAFKPVIIDSGEYSYLLSFSEAQVIRTVTFKVIISNTKSVSWNLYKRIALTRLWQT